MAQKSGDAGIFSVRQRSGPEGAGFELTPEGMNPYGCYKSGMQFSINLQAVMWPAAESLFHWRPKLGIKAA
jgi:hypothetical protein